MKKITVECQRPLAVMPNLVVQFTLFKLRGAGYAHHSIDYPHKFENLAASLSRNTSIYNIILWFNGPMGQMTR